jgi:hypothetical protein
MMPFHRQGERRIESEPPFSLPGIGRQRALAIIRKAMSKVRPEAVELDQDEAELD